MTTNHTPTHLLIAIDGRIERCRKQGRALYADALTQEQAQDVVRVYHSHDALTARVAALEAALRYVAQGGDGDTEYLAKLAQAALKGA